MSELTTTDPATELDPSGPTEPADAEQPCMVCPHPWSGHDKLGVRYCTATVASASSRGCICR